MIKRGETNDKMLKCLKYLRCCAEKLIENTKTRFKNAEALSPGELVLCAKIWKNFFQDDAEGRRCLKESEKFLKIYGEWRSRLWNSTAKSWMEIFGDEQEANRCLKKAEKFAETSYDLKDCAETWITLFVDEQEAKRCMKEAEQFWDA